MGSNLHSVYSFQKLFTMPKSCLKLGNHHTESKEMILNNSENKTIDLSKSYLFVKESFSSIYDAKETIETHDQDYQNIYLFRHLVSSI